MKYHWPGCCHINWARFVRIHYDELKLRVSRANWTVSSAAYSVMGWMTNVTYRWCS